MYELSRYQNAWYNDKNLKKYILYLINKWSLPKLPPKARFPNLV